MNSSDKKTFLRSLVSEIESELGAYYGFSQHSNVADHIIERDEVRFFLGDDAKKLKEWEARAAVWLAEQPDELFIGMHIKDELLDTLSNNDPRRGLNDSNLDAFTIVVEEVSHFHMILNRAASERQVNRTELETQGEIDKLLLSALYLQRQHGDPHILHLARKLFDQALIIADDYETYWQATKHAARFWFHIGHTEKQLTPAVRNTLQQKYQASWHEKYSHTIVSAA